MTIDIDGRSVTIMSLHRTGESIWLAVDRAYRGAVAAAQYGLDTVRDDGDVAGGAVDAIARSGPAGGISEEDS